jgi:acyl-coenzyme A synthetase/AMP-(fatty) acid ligase
MSTLPLVSHAAAESIVAWRAGGAVTRRQFLSEVEQLAARFPAGAHLLNLCKDRYRFAVGLAAAITSGKLSLLPATHTPGVVRQIREFAPDVFCLTDSDTDTVQLPQLRYPDMAARQVHAPTVPQIDCRQRVAVVFTSGSSGVPQPHAKSWGALAGCVQAEAAQLDLLHDTPCSIVGTVPPQHMYGFESTVLMAWHNGFALTHALPFFPADICKALAAVPAPRLLVSSPVHLRALLDAGPAIPAIAKVVCATAPLSPQFAQEIERRCNAPLMEIYGSTETGQIASRRTAQTAQWRLFPGLRFEREGERVRACGGHVETATTMGDVIEPVGDTHFLLHGRITDMINIAGKRHSLASLNHLLNTIPGVADGAFYMPDEVKSAQGGAPERVVRLAACVVAPALTAADVLAALREHLDPVFLPRPLLFVDALPRNSTGKLPREALQALFTRHGARTSHG